MFYYIGCVNGDVGHRILKIPHDLKTPFFVNGRTPLLCCVVVNTSDFILSSITYYFYILRVAKREERYLHQLYLAPSETRLPALCHLSEKFAQYSC